MGLHGCCWLFQAFLNIILCAVLLDVPGRHDRVRAPIGLSPLLDRGRHFTSVWLELEFVIHDALFRDLAVVISTRPQCFLLRFCLGVNCSTAVDTRSGKLLPGTALDSFGHSLPERFAHAHDEVDLFVSAGLGNAG